MRSPRPGLNPVVSKSITTKLLFNTQWIPSCYRILRQLQRGDDESRIKSYYVDLLNRGLPFDSVTSAEYALLRAADFKDTLIELRFKAKTSPPMQLADLYLWPIAMHRYGRGGLPYEKFREAGTLIEAKLSSNLISSRGAKCSCFQLVDESMR
jgi:hypothetical protein